MFPSSDNFHPTNALLALSNAGTPYKHAMTVVAYAVLIDVISNSSITQAVLLALGLN
jgi:hypothetical protein